jgi:glyoxylase-like metal-dependent hydrolase (beta-lactamase superfamily II)
VGEKKLVDKLPVPASSDPGVYNVFALRYGRLLTRRISDNFMIRDAHDGPMPIDYNMWILHNAQRTVLVDTGFGARAAAERGRQLDIDPLEALRRVGVDPDAIDDVVITHMHYDHAGNLGRFAKARFHVQDSEVNFVTGRCMCEKHFRFAFDVEDVVALVRRNFEERVRFHDGDASLLPGITLHVLPGHTPGIQAVRVMTPRGPVLLASDVTHYYANFVRRSPFVLTVDAKATLESYTALQRIVGSVDRIVPGHDPKVRKLYPILPCGGLDLVALHETPKHHDLEDLARVDNI